jgi:threonine dehydrogenase-like Zn-dependent dehydrogenase
MVERLAVPAASVLKIPDGMDFQTAAALVMTYGTSYYALKDRANQQPGERLLVLGAAGGVGVAAVELGKAMGASVTAAASTNDKVQFALEAGADNGLIYPSGKMDKTAQKELSGELKLASGRDGPDVQVGVMNDLDAIAGNIAAYRTLADGSLRVTVDLPETETQHFHSLFPAVHCEVAIAPMRPVQMANSQTTDYGMQARELKLSTFMGQMAVWKAAGSDAKFLEWVRLQKCIARSGQPCDGPVQAAHVWRLKDDFGKGIKNFRRGLDDEDDATLIEGRETQPAVETATDKAAG